MAHDFERILQFWLEDIPSSNWYVSTPEIDAEIRDKFLETWQAGHEGRLEHWLHCARGTLGYLILLDQFPRNMFRGSEMSFASDRKALTAAKMALPRGFDKKIDGPARQFFYLPLVHSEVNSDQALAVSLFMTRMPEAEANLLHARAHREVIRRFGRFPFRNAALGRISTQAEQDYVDGGGYMSTVKELEAA